MRETVHQSSTLGVGSSLGTAGTGLSIPKSWPWGKLDWEPYFLARRKRIRDGSHEKVRALTGHSQLHQSTLEAADRSIDRLILPVAVALPQDVNLGS